MDMTTARARDLRRRMTPPEVRLWLDLRKRQFPGVRFRRQAPIGPYIADFASFDPKLVVEVDGAVHDTPDALHHDAVRTAYLERSGFRVLRFSAVAVFSELDSVCDGIVAVLAEMKR